MRVRPAKLESETRKPLFELFGQPWTRGKAANEKHELIVVNQELWSGMPEYTDRVDGKALPEVIPDGVHGRLNRRFEEPRNLCTICENVLAPTSS